MSVLRIETNVLGSEIDETILVQSTDCLAKTLNKSKYDILVFINANQPIMFAGSKKPAAILTLISMEEINGVNNKLHSSALFPLITKYLKVHEDRILIDFNDVEPHTMGKNGKTFIQ